MVTIAIPGFIYSSSFSIQMHWILISIYISIHKQTVHILVSIKCFVNFHRMPRRKTEQEKNKERNKNTCDNESD